MLAPWSSELAAALRRDREELLVAFVILPAQLRGTDPEEFGGAQQRLRLLQETEHDYAALVAAGAEATRLETSLECADRQATEREADSAALLIRQMRELVAAVAARLPSP